VAVLVAAPSGYRYVPAEPGRADARYNVHLEEARLVAELFAWVGLERLSLSQVAQRLAQRGIPSPRGRALWDRTTLRNILRNPAYQGQAAFGKTRLGLPRSRLRPVRNHTGRPHASGQGRYLTPPEQWISIPVPALVEPELFAAVGRQLEENRRRQRQGCRGARWLLQGLTVCQCCGYAYCGSQQPVRPSPRHPQGQRYRYYHCLGGDADRFGGRRVCANRAVRERDLDEAVWQDVRTILADPQRIEQELQRRLHAGDAPAQQEALRRLQAQMAKQRRGIARLIDAYSEGLLTKPEFEPRVTAARQTLARTQEQLQAQLDQQAQADQLRLVSDNLQAFARQVHAGLDQADWQTRRQIIRTLVKRVEVGTQEIKVVYRVDINGPEHRSEEGFLQDCRGRATC
jgi:site-specific DNA recombinase